MKKQFRDFKEARKFVHSLKLRNQNDWSQFSKSGNKPNDIPTTPARSYKKEWLSWGDWLGTGTIANKNKKYLSFSDAKKIVHSLGIKTKEDWDIFAKSNKKPKNIPTNPHRSYKKEWLSYGDWLGTGRIATHQRDYRSFAKARNYVHTLELKNQKSWFEFSKSNKKPEDVPIVPNQVYKDKGWISWGDWLGTGSVGPGLKKYRTFDKAREFVHTLGLTGANEWRIFVKANTLPNDIPKNPNQVYKDKGWISWGDWTGTNVIATYKIKYRKHSEAKKFVRSLGLKTANEWRAFVKSGKLPKDIPANPWTTYSKKRKNK